MPKGKYNSKRKYNKKKSSNKKYSGVKTNRQLTRAVKNLKELHEIKYHYVTVDNRLINVITTDQETTALDGIGSGTGPTTHDQDGIKIRSLNIHGQWLVGNSAGAPTINGPRVCTMLVCKSSVGNAVADVPTWRELYDTGTPASMSLADGFRELETVTTDKVKILAKRTFILEPHGPQAPPAGPTPGQSYPTYPSMKRFSLSVPVRGLKIKYTPGTSQTLNQRLFLMVYCNSGGTGADLGVRFSCASKMTFYDCD